MGWGDLSRDQRQYVQQINDQLMVIERRARQEALALIPQLDARVNNPQDWLMDYEIDLDVSFALRADDPAYRNGQDTILVTLNEWLSHLKRYRDHPDGAGGVGSGYNYNECQSMDGHPMPAEHHCWLYYTLYDHTGVQWEDLLGIGYIWVDLKVIYQYSVDVES